MKYYKYVVVPLGVPTNFCYCYWIRLPGQETRDMGLMPWSGRAPGEGNGNPLQYSCLENSMDKGAWWATVHGVAKSWYGWAHTHSMWLVVVWCYSLSCLRLFVTQWTVAHQAPLSIEFSRQGSWSGLPFPSPGDLPNSGIKPRSPALQADSLPSEPPGKPFL